MKFFLFSICIAGLLAVYFNHSLYSQNNKQVILQPDNTLGRTCGVYSNTLIIRFKKTIDSYKKAYASIDGTDLQLVSSILERKQSIKNNKTRILSEKPEILKKIIQAEEPLLRTYIIHYNSDLAPEKYAKRLLKSNPDIEIAEPYCLDEIQSIPNDPYITNQKMLYTIHAFDAWDEGLTGDTSVVIGISDNGVYQEHEDLVNSIAPNWGEIPNNDIDDDDNRYVDDFMGYNFAYLDDNCAEDYTKNPNNDHGTNVAGIAGATVNNSIGMAGVANNCRIFPIKIAKNSDPTHLPYGYQSILYAVARKLKVLNCSWGAEKMFSELDQSIIDYAVANDVAIVAAGGNGYHSTQAWYPAGYRGVLGVGEVDQDDFASGATSFGSHISIMAPGEGNFYTTNSNTYKNTEGGTSLASPVVAAAVALVRAKYPELNAIQSLEFVRQCTDDISELNGSSKDIIPGRLNLLKAAQIAPFSIPSIKPLSVEFSNYDGTWLERGRTGDTLILKINAFNYLGTATNLRFVLSSAKDPLKTINIIDSVVNIPDWLGGISKVIQPFKFIITQTYSNLMFFRIDIYADNDYHDFFLLPYIPASEITTFANKSIRYSVGDRGTYGFGGLNSNNTEGVGFTYKNYGNQLYTNAGLIAVENNSNVVSAIFSNVVGAYNDFTSVKPFINPERYHGIMNDEFSNSHKIGLELEESFHFVSDTLPATKILLTIKNISGKVLNDVAVGYFLDWDIGPEADSNKVRLFPEAIPETFTAISAVAELVRYVGNYPVFAAACYSPDITFEAQAASFNTHASSFTKELQIQALNNGTSMQYDEIGDVKMVVGMKFPGELQPGETKKCTVCIGAGDNETSLAQIMQECLLGIVGVEDNPDEQADISVYPQPAKDMINVRINSEYRKIVLCLFDYLGRDVILPITANNESGKQIIPININYLPSGMYYLTMQSGPKIISKPIMVLK